MTQVSARVAKSPLGFGTKSQDLLNSITSLVSNFAAVWRCYSGMSGHHVTRDGGCVLSPSSINESLSECSATTLRNYLAKRCSFFLADIVCIVFNIKCFRIRWRYIACEFLWWIIHLTINLHGGKKNHCRIIDYDVQAEVCFTFWVFI